jgi:hypothetical protein
MKAEESQAVHRWLGQRIVGSGDALLATTAP